MADVILRTYQQLLGPMYGQVLDNTDLTDLFKGSAIDNTLQAAASSDFTIEGKLLQLLAIRDINRATGVDLTNLAAEMGLSPPRLGANPSTASLTIGDSAFAKVATQVYAGLPAPAAGSTSLAVVDASAFNASGTIYIGRGTSTYEVAAYASKSFTGPYWTLSLSAPLGKNHLVGEEVVMAQGGDRLVPNGTTAQVPPSAGIPSVQFRVNQDYTIPDGEDTIVGVLSTSTTSGSSTRVGSGTISQFANAPFTTATVTNPSAAANGSDTETDPELRIRLKDYVHNLGKGTVTAISSGVLGVSDPVQGDSVVSSFFRAPTVPGQYGVLFVDDGSPAGFQPTFAGVGEEDIVLSASGTEQQVQLQNWPVMKAQLGSVNAEPFALSGGEALTFLVDGTSEGHAIPPSFYANPGAALAQEVAQAVNALFTSVEARAKAGQLFVNPVADNPGYIQVQPSVPDANLALALPLNRQYTIRLYKDDRLLFANGFPAVAQTKPSSQWPAFSSTETLQVQVDGVLAALATYTDSEFALFTGSSTINGASPADWAIMFNRTLIGITAAAQSDGTVTLTSNRGISSAAQVLIVGGSLDGSLFPAGAGGSGANSDFAINRLLGQVQLAERLSAGDTLKAGTVNTRAFLVGSTSAAFNLSDDPVSGAPPLVAVVADGTSATVPVVQSGVVTLSSPSSGVQRVAGSVGQFSAVKPDDYALLYGTPRPSTILKAYSVASDGSYVDFLDPTPATGTATLDGVHYRASFFRTAGLPQLWAPPVGAAVGSAAVALSFNQGVSGARATVTFTGAIEYQTLAFSSAGGLAFAVVAGDASNLGVPDASSLASNDPHVGSITSADLAGLPSNRVVASALDSTFPYDSLSVSGTPWSQPKFNDLPLLTYIGSAEQFMRQPQQLGGGGTSPSSVTLRTTLPQQCVGFNAESRMANTDGLEMGQDDNIVFLMDDTAATKTFNVPMFVEAIVTGPTPPTTTQVDASDLKGNDLGGSTAWLGYPFADYKVLCKARVDMATQGPNTGIRATAVLWGENGRNLQIGVVYPTAPGQPATASFAMDNSGDVTDVSLALSSGTARSIGLTTGAPIFVNGSGGGPTYGIQVQFAPPVSMSTVVPGDIASLSDASFSPANRGTFAVTATSNLSDPSKQYQFLQEPDTGSVSGGTTLTLNSAPAQTLRAGDRVTATGQDATVSSVGAGTITITTGTPWTSPTGSFKDGANSFTYTGYTSGTGVVTGVSPNPVGIVNNGDTVVQAITPVTVSVVSGTYPTFTVTAGIPNGTNYALTLSHASLTVSSAPSFSPLAGDVVQVLSNVYRVSTVYSSTELAVNNPFSFSGLQSGTISRVWLQGTRYSPATNEQDVALSSQSVQVYPLNSGGNTASALIAAANGTAGVDELVLLSNSAGSNGSGTITLSTQDATGMAWQPLRNGATWVLSSANSHPSVTFKYPLDMPLEIGEHFRLQPLTAMNAFTHLSSLQVSGLAVAAEVDLVDDGRRVQVASLIPGGLGQAYAVGGRASGNEALEVLGNVQQLSSTRAVIEMDISAMEFLQPGHTIRVAQSGRAKKALPALGPSDTIQVSIPSLGQAIAAFSQPVATVYSYTHTGTVLWAVRAISRGRVRYEAYSGTASVPAGLLPDDWVLVGNGSRSYAGTTPASFFASANTGLFQVRETDNSTYFDVDNSLGVEQWVQATSAPFVFMAYGSAQVGDQLVLGANVPVSQANRGTFMVTAIPSLDSVQYANPIAVAEGPFTLGAGGAAAAFVLDQGFSTYRQVVQSAPNPSDPSNSCLVSVSPGLNASLLNQQTGASVTLPNRLGFPAGPVPGMNGYQYWTGLLQAVQRTLDGYAPDPADFPGLDAAGTFIESRPPQIQQVSMALSVVTTSGVGLSSIGDSVKNAVVGYVNSLGLGQPVVLSEVVSLVQAVPGVASVVFTSPAPTNQEIPIADKAVARISSSAITLT